MGSPGRHLRETLLGTPIVINSLDEIQGHVQSFLERFIVDEGFNYEVEAKFGVYIDRGTNSRISLPVLNSCVLSPGDWYRFESDLSMQQHRYFNENFNQKVSRDPVHWRYRHDKSIDTIYMTPERRKVRVSRDQEGHIIETLEKKRIADLAIHCPVSPFDIRISINTETKLPSVTESLIKSWNEQSERKKDRISYVFDNCIQESGTTRLLHELEVELIHFQQQITDPELPARFISNILDIARYASL